MGDQTTAPERRLIDKIKGCCRPDHIKRTMLAVLGVGVLAFAVFVVAGPASLAAPRSCGSCHATKAAYADWQVSSHASVRCERCHIDRGYLGGLGNSFALAWDMARSVVGTTGASVAVPDSACASCHSQADLAKPAVVRGLRISHSGLAEGGYRCTDCHAGVAHKVPASPKSAPTMSVCARCHNNVKLSGKCTLCHTEAKSADVVRRIDPEWSKTHGPRWRQMHGMGDLSTCTMCHKSQECQKCHGVPLPHDENFVVEHGAIAQQSKQQCLSCHNQSFCDNCHMFPMPHPVGFLATHPKIAHGVEDPRCVRCHVQDDCGSCHKAHIHPNGPGIGTAIPR